MRSTDHDHLKLLLELGSLFKIMYDDHAAKPSLNNPRCLMISWAKKSENKTFVKLKFNNKINVKSGASNTF